MFLHFEACIGAILVSDVITSVMFTLGPPEKMS